MMSIVEKISLGRLVDWLARAVGWSPVGKTLTIRSAEGPFSEIFNGMAGTVLSLDDGVMALAADRPHSAGLGGGASVVRLTPRHKGWTAFSLMWTDIAVVVEARTADGSPGPVAIGIANIERHRSRTARG